MSKKEYSAKEIAEAILKKAEQTIKSSKLMQKSMPVKEAVDKIKGPAKVNEVLKEVDSKDKKEVLADLRDSKIEKADPQNQNPAQVAGLKGVKLPSVPKGAEKPEMKPPQPQAAAKMPKPLKNFMAKREEKQKGVHNAHFMASQKTGTSDVGARMMEGVKPSDQTKKYAVQEHKKVLSDLKDMPKPNLPKSEK